MDSTETTVFETKGLEVGRDVKSENINIINHVKNTTVINSPSSGKSEVTSKPPFRFNIPNPTKHFRGREDTLKAARDFFDKAVDTSHVLDRTVVIAGSGGMGKTETACKVAVELQGKFPCAAWINAETEQNLLDSFLDLAKELGIVQLDEKNADVKLVKNVYQHIDKEDYGRVLFIFDNAIRLNSSGDEFGVYNLLPTEHLVNKCYPHILITTRTHEWGKQIKVLRVESLSLVDSTAFFSSAFRVHSAECNEEFNKLHEITEGYPLVMNLVASHIDYNRNDNSVRELQQKINLYIQEFETDRSGKILSQEIQQWPTNYKKTLSSVWQMLFKRLEQEQNGPEALKVLQIMSFLNRPIYSRHVQIIWLLNTKESGKSLAPSNISLRYKDLFYLLERFYAARILRIKQDNECEFECFLDIHRVVQLAVRQQTNCSQALEHIVCYQAAPHTYKWGNEVNISALQVALERTELTTRALASVGILACYGNPVARKIVETKKPEAEAAATIWRLYNLERGMTSLNENAIRVLRELVKLAKSAEVKMDTLNFTTLMKDLLTNPEKFEYLRKDGTKTPGYFSIISFQADGPSTSTRSLETLVAHTGADLIDNVMSHVTDEMMWQVAFKVYNNAHSNEMVSDLAHHDNVLDEPNLDLASESLYSPEISPNLARPKVQDEPNIEFTTGPSVRRRRHVQNSTKEFPPQTGSKFGEPNVGGSVVETEKSEQLTSALQVHERKQIVNVHKAGCSKKAIVWIVLALILASFFLSQFAKIWLENLENDAIDIKILKNQSRPAATGIFVATNEGLVALDLRTSKPTALTTEYTLAVAVNQKLMKVYWTEGLFNSQIMRSNFNGSGKEVIVPPADDNIYMLAIDEQTSKVYYALYWSNEITVCNALGQNCAGVISYSSLVRRPVGIALDTKNGFMYWGHRSQSIIFTRPHSLVRAKLDGSDATVISTGFQDLKGITLDQPSSNVLYWIDDDENTIGSININGGNKRTILRLEDETEGLTTIKVDAKEIYYSSYEDKNIKSVRKDSGKEMRTIFTSTSHVESFELFSDSVKQS